MTAITKPIPVPPGSKCTKCLVHLSVDEFLANDHICNTCTDLPEDFPFSSPSHFAVHRPVDMFEDNE